jgi:hypothetical protein
MSVYSPCTWNMTAAQLVTPTSSALAAVNAIQAMIQSSTYWTVTTTGTTTAGYKYVEARLTNTSSIYKDYRVLFVERINSSTGKNFWGTNPFNTTTNVMVYFAPDGGSSWCTFTPSNIETGNNAYVGTRYTYSGAQWMNLPGLWTAFWMYECDGQMCIINRSGATAYYLTTIGATYISSRATHVDYNEAGTEVGLPGMMQRTSSYSSASVVSSYFTANCNLLFWFNSSGTTKTASYSSAPFPSGEGSLSSSQSPSIYNTTSNSAVFKPIIMGTNNTGLPSTSSFVVRGIFWGSNMQTRTTVKDAAGVNTLGYSWYPDDTATATANQTFMFMNTP